METKEEYNARKRAEYWANPEKQRKRKRTSQKVYDAKYPEERKQRAKNWRTINKDRRRLYDGLPLPTRSEPLYCEACGNAGPICLDHCHKTGLFRAWLCHRCNLTLGRVKDNPILLRKLANILEDFTSRSNAGAETLEVSSGLAQEPVGAVRRYTTDVASNTNSSSEVPTL
jgi:hypothetical protein